MNTDDPMAQAVATLANHLAEQIAARLTPELLAKAGQGAGEKAAVKLVYSLEEVRALFGGISVVSVWRFEKRGLLQRVPGIGRALFTGASVRALASGETGESRKLARKLPNPAAFGRN